MAERVVEIGEKVNPQILVWARETAGLEEEEAASRISLGSSKSSSSLDRLRELESGQRLPTRKQLEEISKLYRRPLLTFYRSTQPPKGDRGKDFRTTSSELTKRENALLDALIRNIKARQGMLATVLEDDEEHVDRPFVGSCSLADGVAFVANRIADDLRFSEIQRKTGAVDEFFNTLRGHVEALGVFVLLIGDLGSHHSSMSEQVFRGFTLADPVAPFIIINDRDAKIARPFTLLHELTHIYLGESAISGPDEQDHPHSTYPAIEKFCDEVAGHILLPADALSSAKTGVNLRDQTAVLQYITTIADRWVVSGPLIAYRLRQMNLISAPLYSQLRRVFSDRWNSYKSREKEPSQGGPSYYVVRTHRLGRTLIDTVRRAMRENRLTHTKAAAILGVKPSSIENLFAPQTRSSSRREVA